MKRLLAFLFVLLPVLSSAQNSPDPYTRDWTRADSFLSQGLPQSARTVVESVAAKAISTGQPLFILKAQLYLLQIDQQSVENADSASIARAEERARTSAFPYNAVWQSIAAQLYWNYYLENRWQIYSRTRTAEAVGDDFENWDASRFVERISALYGQSISRGEELKGLSLEAFEPVLEEGVNTRALRPTLFDLLAYRALAFYEWDEKDLPRPAFAFVMDDAGAFAPASDFIRHDFKTRDTASLQHRALTLYQELLRLHKDDAKPDAFLEADLARLEFAKRTSVLRTRSGSDGTGAKDLPTPYQSALERIAKNYASNPLSALAAYRLASSRFAPYIHDEEPPRPYRGYGGDDGDGRKRPKRKPANSLKYWQFVGALDSIIARHPQSEGGVLAAQRRAEMLRPQLSIQTEEAVIAGEPSKILVEYRNMPQVHLRVVKLTLEEAQRAWRSQYRTDVKDALVQKLTTGVPVQKFSIELPSMTPKGLDLYGRITSSNDYAPHSTELKIDALPPGLYAIVYSKNADFSTTDNLLGYAVFNSTRLALITQDGYGPSGYVLDRKTGAPVAGASLTFYDEKWNGSAQNYSYTSAATATTGADGTYTLAGSKNSFAGYAVRKGDDLHAATDYIHFNRYTPENRAQTRAFLFTDRSIYRPGQTVFFKGILLRTTDFGRKSVAVPNAAVDVTFYDANGQKVATQKLTSNDYGSFTGNFAAPTGGLTGQMRLEAVTAKESVGNEYVSVEEYKRPKFRVTEDTTVKAEYALNETVTLRSIATSYSGAPVDGAQVKYRVVRQARWPYYWYSWRWGADYGSPSQEIAQGTATTDADGAFTVSFTTLPDATIDERSLPTFTYTVTADVTDVNGETRTGMQNIYAGYRSLQISADVPEKATPEELDTLRITTQNLAGRFVAARVDVKLQKLQAPDKLYRARRWPMPDQFAISEREFRTLFPLDEYREESDYRTWAEGATVHEASVATTEGGRVAIPQGALTKNGWYVLTLSTKDKAGRAVEDKRYVHLWAGEGAGKAEDPLLVVPQSATKEPGQTVSVLTTSGFERATILQQAHLMPTAANRNAVSRASKDFGGRPLLWEKKISEEDRGGIALHFLTVKENRVYTGASSIAVPWSNKDLDISWETHRDKLLPGAQETWTMVVRGAKSEKVAAELAATLYDASLDAFRPHRWSFGQLFPMLNAGADWNTGLGFGSAYANALASEKPDETLPTWEKVYEDLVMLDAFMGGVKEDGFVGYGSANGGGVRRPMAVRSRAMADGAVMAEASTVAPAPEAKNVKFTPPVLAEDAEADETQPLYWLNPLENQGALGGNVQDIPLRKNLQETAFFFPQLRTDADGAVRIQFTIPEALTEWKLLAIAHTPEMATGAFSGTVKTQKDLMVVPGLPRFLRQGDEIALSAKITNLSDAALQGTAMLEILDAQTGRSLTLPFGLRSLDQSFSAPKGGSTTAVWNLRVPESLYEPVIIRIRAKSGVFTDGEENVLPVITNRMLVTETLPLWMNGAGTKRFSLEKLLQSGGSRTLAQHALTLEYTGNPAWYAVQALPYLMEYPHECSEQTFNRYYANALAAHIADKAPRVKEIFKQWEAVDTAALMSNLQKNEELKSALLEETPWVMEAKTETEQKHRIALLFQSAKLSRDLDKTARTLEDMLLDEGGFPWFKGSPYPDRYITQYIATGIGRLQHLGVKSARMDAIADRILPYLDRQLVASYEALLKNKADTSKQQIGYSEVQYLYMRSLFPGDKPSAAAVKAAVFYRRQAQKFWPTFNPYMKGQAALVLHRAGERSTPKTILQSLRETAQESEELGMWWMERGRSWWWYDAPIEAQALLVEAFQEVSNDVATADKARRWLLKQKQTQNWETTRATADACYALLLQGTQWLSEQPEVVINLGEQPYMSGAKSEAGTGYFKIRIPGSEVKPSMGDITLTVSETLPERQSNGNASVPRSLPTWGAVYWQYFEDLDKISAAQTPLAIRKGLFIERATDRGPVLERITDGNALRIGDKVKARIEIHVDRDMEYVHLKDGRGACFEPTNIISGYRWQGGLGYYESTRDVSSNFFFDRLPKGKYVFEYPMFVTHAGDFSAGLATIQCMYAPEFSAHSEGMRVKVR